jgi:membrane fusion protein (multidrug efflux system)
LFQDSGGIQVMASNEQDRQTAEDGQGPGSAQPSPPAGEKRPTPSKLWHKNPVLLVLLAILIIGGGLGGWAYWQHVRQYEDSDDAFIDGEIVQVGARVAGIIQDVEVKDNQDIATGTVLVKIDPRDYQAKLNEAKAELEAAQARLEVARTNVDLAGANTEAVLAEAQAGVAQAKAAIQSSKSQLASAQADVTAAEAEATRRQADLQRYKSLDLRAVSRQQLDAAQAAADSTQANLAAVRKRASAAESAVTEVQAKQAYAEGVLAAAKTGPQQVASTVAQAKTTQAAVNQAKAAVDEAELNLSYTTISAPVAGRVTRRTARPGQYLQVGQTVLALVQPDVWVTANFKESQLAHMSRGQDVEIAVDAYPGQTFHGQVDSIQAGSGARFSLLPPENATGNYVKVVQRVPVKIVLDPEVTRKWLLAPGMSVVPKVHVDIGGQQRPLPITY